MPSVQPIITNGDFASVRSFVTPSTLFGTSQPPDLDCHQHQSISVSGGGSLRETGGSGSSYIKTSSMASFSFSFSGDDINEDAGAAAGDVQDSTAVAADAPHVPAQVLSFEQMLASLPSQIAYTTAEIESPKGKTFLLPRRELFDIRVQLAAEDNDDALRSIDASDIRTNVYEGGFKSWECSLDLARLILDRGPRKDIDDLCRVSHVIELGCGTALPSLVLWHYALANDLALYFTFTDYNADVLRLVTLPNLLLTWCLARSEGTFASGKTQGELEITDELKTAFVASLRDQDVHVNFVAGSWSPAADFTALIPSDTSMNTFILASETIYSPSSLSTFTEALVELLKRVKMGKAMVAAKRVYFGVGGSVDSFKREASQRGAVAYDIDNHHLNMDMGESGGVKRCLMEVQMM